MPVRSLSTGKFQKPSFSTLNLFQAAESAGHTAQALEELTQKKVTLEKEKTEAETLVQELKSTKEQMQTRVSG